MDFYFRSIFLILFSGATLTLVACSVGVEPTEKVERPVTIVPADSPSPTPPIPNLQAELIDDRNKTTTSLIGKFDFKNHTYQLPRGWQNPDGTTEITLVNGRIPPIEGRVVDEMTNEAKAEEKSRRRIGLSYVTTKYLDVIGDGQDEAIVILKIETGGAAIPQIAYSFAWKDEKPELIWTFRTGDRADGGLKDIRVEVGEVVVELFGQDRFVLGQTETGKVTGDEEQLCCPIYFTRSFYKWNGNTFQLRGKRLTFSLIDPSVPPVENMGDVVNSKSKSTK